MDLGVRISFNDASVVGQGILVVVTRPSKKSHERFVELSKTHDGCQQWWAEASDPASYLTTASRIMSNLSNEAALRETGFQFDAVRDVDIEWG